MSPDVATVTGLRLIPPYVTRTAELGKHFESSVALDPPTQFKASLGLGRRPSRISGHFLKYELMHKIIRSDFEYAQKLTEIPLQ